MRNTETGETKKVHVWTGADTEERAMGIAKSTSSYAGNEQWVADAAELKESNESYTDFEAKKLARHFLEVIEGEGASLKKFKPFLFQHMIDMYTGDYSESVIKKASDMLKDGKVIE